MIVYEGNSVAEALKQFYFSSPGLQFFNKNLVIR